MERPSFHYDISASIVVVRTPITGHKQFAMRMNNWLIFGSIPLRTVEQDGGLMLMFMLRSASAHLTQTSTSTRRTNFFVLLVLWASPLSCVCTCTYLVNIRLNMLTMNFKTEFKSLFSGYWTNQSDPESLGNYRAGFNECATKVCSFMENQKSGVDSKLREQMLAGLAASCSYNIHTTTPGQVRSDSPVSYSPGSAVYGSQSTGESRFLCASTPPPSPPSSAFSPFIPYEGAMLRKSGNASCSYHAAVESAARHESPVESSSPPLWRPWTSNTQNGQI